jgi:hypothetical protein
MNLYLSTHSPTIRKNIILKIRDAHSSTLSINIHIYNYSPHNNTYNKQKNIEKDSTGVKKSAKLMNLLPIISTLTP